VSGVLYLDASALVKLAVEEPEGEALREAGVGWEHRAASVVATVELTLAVHRAAGADAGVRAMRVLAPLEVIELTPQVIERAGRAAPLRALDAIHLASALSIGNRLGAFVTYDRQLGCAATAAGLDVLSPGAPAS
jgi:predicted nucleic acid-binding protein